ncbi:MAG: hypothetical protein M3R25_10905 [Bacteroidota bacterium]|nr:hypothetical protein [Bacteroidota bacterium]
MGLTIFYSGSIRDMQLIPALVNEVCDICDDLYWRCEIVEPSEDIPISGVLFCPPGSEEIWLTFLPNGRMARPESLFNIVGEKKNLSGSILLDSIVQWAGPDAHMQMIELLKYLSPKYFRRLKVTDESEYWETGNPEKCRDWFGMFEVWTKNMSEDLDMLDGRGYEGGQTYQQRLMDLFMKGVSFDEIIKVMGDPYRNSSKGAYKGISKNSG